MSSYTIDPRSILVDALKMDPENFQISNLILKNHRAMQAVYELYNLRSDLLEFAKNAEIGQEMIPPPPRPPKVDEVDDETKDKLLMDYSHLLKMYEDQKQSYTMHVPYADYIMIHNYLEKYYKTLFATPAVKGNRFYAFTKNTEQQEDNGIFGFLRRHKEQGG